MGMADIIAAVHADPLLATYISPIQGTVAVPGLLGAHGRWMRYAAPVAVWVPARESFGPSNPTGSSPLTFTGGIPRVSRTRSMGFDVHLQAELSPLGNVDDFATADELLNRFAFAIHRVLRGSYELTGGRWLGQEGEEILNDRKVYVLSLEVMAPIFDPTTTGTGTSVTITSAPVTGGISTTSTPPP